LRHGDRHLGRRRRPGLEGTGEDPIVQLAALFAVLVGCTLVGANILGLWAGGFIRSRAIALRGRRFRPAIARIVAPPDVSVGRPGRAVGVVAPLLRQTVRAPLIP
jgi:hypothetical protein